MQIRQIKAKDDEFIYNLIRSCLEDAQLNIPGTAYFDESIKKKQNWQKLLCNHRPKRQCPWWLRFCRIWHIRQITFAKR